MTRRIIFSVIFAIFFGVLLLNNQFKGHTNGQEKLFRIEEEQTADEVSEKLEEEKIVKNGFIFRIYVRLKGEEKNLKAGVYVLNSGSDIKEILKILTSGKVLTQEREIKIIEGWNSSDIAEYLSKEKIANKDDFLNSIKASGNVTEKFGYDFLASIPEEKGLEGFLFPDTYRIYKNSAALDITAKMLENFDKKLTPRMREDITKMGRDLYKTIIMASIIEKEVRSIEDMKAVSDIFWRRLNSGMPLQSCATIAYVLGENKPKYTYEETRIESPYNTYLNPGLPPTPICNPGLSAIGAAIYPKNNNYWFFLSKEDGTTVFSKTLDEHNVNKAKYLKG